MEVESGGGRGGSFYQSLLVTIRVLVESLFGKHTQIKLAMMHLETYE